MTKAFRAAGRWLVCLLSVVTAATLSAGTSTANQKDTDMTTPTKESNGDVTVTMHTTEGDIRLRLYGDTPKHMSNFVRLAKEGYYDGLLFHRVINDFMIQGGDPDSRNAPKGKALGMGDPSYQIDAEIVYPRHFHRRGALAAARQGDATNPERRSSGSQFYIVTGKIYSPQQLQAMEQQMKRAAIQEEFSRLATERRDSIMSMRRNRDNAGLQALQEELAEKATAAVNANPPVMTDEQRRAYTTEGGTPHLDNAYTVFGEVIEGMDVVDRIQKVETDRADRPLEDVKIISIDIE